MNDAPAFSLSYIININGKIVGAMPDDEEFSAQEISDFVAGAPETLCETPDGFVLIHNKNGRQNGLPINQVATALHFSWAHQQVNILGRVFLGHPDHIPAHSKRRSATA